MIRKRERPLSGLTTEDGFGCTPVQHWLVLFAVHAWDEQPHPCSQKDHASGQEHGKCQAGVHEFPKDDVGRNGSQPSNCAVKTECRGPGATRMHGSCMEEDWGIQWNT